MRIAKGFVACVVAVLALAGSARAELLVDTGPGGTSSIGALSLFNNGGVGHFQYLAGKFTLTEAAQLDSVEGWMGPFGLAGSIDVKIRTGGAIPGAAIYSKNYSLGFRFSAGWDVFTAFDVALPAGTYWLSFEPVGGSGFNYSMPAGAPSPLASYAYLADGNPGWIAQATSLGMRVSGAPVAAAPFGSGTRTIVMIGQNVIDRILGGQGEQETIDWNINLSGYGWSAGVGTIYANWLQAGAVAVCSQASNASRSVAFRSFENTTAGPLTFRVNGVLGGDYDAIFGDTNLAATGGIHALDSAMFASTVAASGVGAAEFLLRNDSLSPTQGAADRLNLSTLFPVAARLGNAVVQVPYQTGTVAAPVQTSLITVDPQEVFTLLFDVSALASGSGTGATNFFNTLEPAAVLFTDAGGAPVVGIAALGEGILVGEASFLLWDDGSTLSWMPAVGASDNKLYRGDGADLTALLDASPDACLRYQGGTSSSGSILTENPLPGEFFWYLAVGLDGPTEGSAGLAAGAERIVNSTGSCN